MDIQKLPSLTRHWTGQSGQCNEARKQKRSHRMERYNRSCWRHDRPLECLQKSKTPSYKWNTNIPQGLEFIVSYENQLCWDGDLTPVVLTTKEAEARGSLKPRSQKSAWATDSTIYLHPDQPPPKRQKKKWDMCESNETYVETIYWRWQKSRIQKRLRPK